MLKRFYCWHDGQTIKKWPSMSLFSWPLQEIWSSAVDTKVSHFKHQKGKQKLRIITCMSSFTSFHKGCSGVVIAAGVIVKEPSKHLSAQVLVTSTILPRKGFLRGTLLSFVLDWDKHLNQDFYSLKKGRLSRIKQWRFLARHSWKKTDMGASADGQKLLTMAGFCTDV